MEERSSHAAAEAAVSLFEQLLGQRWPGRPRTTLIVRAGPLGSYTSSDRWRGWVPAYWGVKEQDQVVDVTGGGNAWLGGLCAGLSLTDGDMRAGKNTT